MNRIEPTNQTTGRKNPAHGVLVSSNEPTIVFLTVCTHQRIPWLARNEVQQSLEEIWRAAGAWLVGFYLFMPDHLHLFCAPHDLKFTLEDWVRFWKSRFRRKHCDQPWEWQRDFWDTRLRRSESYHDKWIYVQENPVRKGLATKPEDWPYQGMLNVLRW